MNKSFPYLKFSFFILGYTVVSFALYEVIGDTYKLWVSGIEKQAKVIQLDHINVHMRGLKTYYYRLDIEGKRSVHKFNFELTEKRYYNVLSINDGEKIILGNKILAYLIFIHPCWEHFLIICALQCFFIYFMEL